jgi:N-hydroxyarylamine O-acetyltransferase
VSEVDLDAYFRRIGWTRAVTPRYEILAGLLRAHTARIPFENLDVLLGRPIRLDLDGLQAKLIAAGRGGYCFEHATLFGAVLEAIGFQVVRHAARVVIFETIATAPRTHMFLTVEVDGGRFVVDPGFGPFAAPFPIRLVEGESGLSHHLTYEDGFWTLHVVRDGEAGPAWVSTLEKEKPIDFEVANHYIATHPQSSFTKLTLLSAATPSGRVNIMNRDMTIIGGGALTKREIGSRGELRALLRDYFGFDLPEVEQMKVPAVPGWD